MFSNTPRPNTDNIFSDVKLFLCWRILFSALTYDSFLTVAEQQSRRYLLRILIK